MSKAYGSGMSNPSPPRYLNDDCVDLIAAVSDVEQRDFPAWVRWAGVNNLVIPKNFILKAWFYPSRTSMKILKLSSVTEGSNDYIDVAYRRGESEDYICVRTDSGTIIDKSFEEILSPQDLCFFWIKHVDGVWDVRVEVIENAPTTILNWNDGTNVLYNATTDIPYEDEMYGSYVATSPVQTNLANTFNSMIISNGIFDHLTITENTNEPYSNVHSDSADSSTLFNCNFNNHIICLLSNAPVLSDIETFNATKDKVVYFNTEDTLTVKNRLQIFDAESDVMVYDTVQITYDFEHTIPAGTLVNGKQYYAKLKTYTRSDSESYWSNIVYFWCYTEPTLTCNIKDGDIIKNSTAGFIVRYDQAEKEKAKWLEINVYDQYGTLVAKSNKMTNKNVPPLNFNFSAMVQTEGEHRAELTLETETGTIVELTINFIVDIDASKEQYLNVEDNCTGYIEVTAYPNVMGMGISKPEPPIYLNHEKVKITSCVADLNDEINSNWVKWSNVGMNIPSNFIMSCWFSPSRIGHKLMRLYSLTQSDYVEIWFERGLNTDYIKVVSGGGTLISTAFPYPVTINDSCFMWLKHASGYWELRVEVLKRGTPIIISWDEASDKRGSNGEINVSTDIQYRDEDYGSYIPDTDNPVPLDNGFDNIVISNGIFDHINIDSNTNTPYSTEIPTESTNTTIMNAAFKDSLSCSDISADKVIIYHTEDNYTILPPEQVNWVKLLEKSLNAGYNDIIFNDLIVKSNITTYYKAEYYSDDVLIDTKYKEIIPNFNRVFISDPDRTFKFEASIIYSNGAQNVQIGQLIPLGSKYPILIQNSMTNFRSGNISMKVMGANFEDTRTLDREEIRAQAEDIIAFLTNRKAKIIKDWNGNLFVFRVTSNPTINYDANYGNGIITLAFDWAEVAEYHDLDALREFGFYTS